MMYRKSARAACPEVGRAALAMRGETKGLFLVVPDALAAGFYAASIDVCVRINGSIGRIDSVSSYELFFIHPKFLIDIFVILAK